MPRAFDSDSDPEALIFTELIDCPACDETFEGTFSDYTQSLSFQDMVDPPWGLHECPECGHSFESEMTGWMFYGEAG